MASNPDDLRAPIAAYREAAAAAGRRRPEVVAMGALALDDPPRARDELAAYADAGVDGIIQTGRYDDAATACARVAALGALRGENA